jgi:hypothetical protein
LAIYCTNPQVQKSLRSHHHISITCLVRAEKMQKEQQQQQHIMMFAALAIVAPTNSIVLSNPYNNST